MNVRYKQLTFLIIIILTLLIIKTIIGKNIENFNDIKNITLEIQSHDGGFFSNFNKLISNLHYYKNVNKIIFNMVSKEKFKAFYFIKDNEELFSKIFDVYDYGTSDNNTNNIKTDSYIDSSITGNNAYKFYNENRIKLQSYHDTYNKYIKIKPHITDKINKKLLELKNNTDQLICIFVRSEALRHEQPSGKMPTRDDYTKALDKIPKSNNVKYFLCVDNNDDLEFYKTKYTPNYFTPIRRTKNKKDGEPHTNNIGTLEDLEDSFVEVMLISHCDILVHCVSNMATASLYINMNQQSIFVSK